MKVLGINHLESIVQISVSALVYVGVDDKKETCLVLVSLYLVARYSLIEIEIDCLMSPVMYFGAIENKSISAQYGS